MTTYSHSLMTAFTLAIATVAAPAAAVVAPFGGSGAPGVDPLGHSYQLSQDSGIWAWGIPGLGFGTVPFNSGAQAFVDGLTYATEFRFVVLAGPTIAPAGNGFFDTRFVNTNTGAFWNVTFVSNQQVHFTAPTFADRLLPGEEFFVNVVFNEAAVDPQRFAFGALWDASVIPEPATWGMLIAGFGMVGVTMRRRRTGIARINA